MKMMKENRGLTLVELMITIAIVSIVIAAATSFMITGSRSFTKGSADSDLQKEAELTVNQIEDMIIDVYGGLDVKEVTDAEGNKTKTELILIHATEEPDDSGAMETKYVKETVVWDKNADDSRIFYNKREVTYDASRPDGDKYVDGPLLTPDQLLAENVSLFEVDKDTIEETAYDGTVHQIVRSVQIRLGYENSTGRVDYATSPVITLRNRMLLSGNPDEIFVVPPTVSANLTLWYYDYGIEHLAPEMIQDRESPVKRGSAYEIYVYLDQGSKVDNALLNWEIEETNRTSMIDSNGVLTVFPNEPNEFLTIVARYKTNPNKYARAAVKVISETGGGGKSLTAVTIIPRWAAGDTVTKPFEPLFSSYPTLEPSGAWTTEEIKRIQYTWTFDVPERVESRSPDTQRDATGQFATLDLKIRQASENYGKILTIWLTAYSPDTGETVYDEYQYLIDPEGTNSGESSLQRGLGVAKDGSVTGHNKINYEFPIDDNRRPMRGSLRVVFCLINGQERTDIDPNEYIAITGWRGPCNIDNNWYGGDSKDIDGWPKEYQLSFKRHLPMDQTYYVKVVASFERDIFDYQNGGKKVGVDKWDEVRIFTIPGVQMYDYHITSGNKKGEFNFYFGLVAYWNVALQDDAKDLIGFKVEELLCEGSEGTKLNVDFAVPVSTAGGADDMMYGWGHIYAGDTDNGALPDYIIPKSMTVKIYMKEYEHICTYVTIYFDNE